MQAQLLDLIVRGNLLLVNCRFAGAKLNLSVEWRRWYDPTRRLISDYYCEKTSLNHD